MIMRDAIIVGTIAVLLLWTGSALAEQAVPETGTIIKGEEGDGICRLDIINNATVDAVAYLCSMNEEVLLAVYIQAQDFFNMTGIDAGSYELYFRQGRDWNSTAGRFENDSSNTRMENPMVFEIQKTKEGVRYTWGQITLTEVAGGNENLDSVSEEDFPA